jgi:Protein of unknown function (DUF3035)
MGGIVRSLKIIGLGLCLGASLSACSSLKNALGMDKQPPDEFAIITKAPLVIPPDFALRPPRPGAQDSQQLTPSQSAEQTVFGKVPSQEAPSADQSQGELALLEAAGAQNAEGSIRSTIAADDKSETSDPSLTDRLMFWKGSGTKDEAVNGVAEQSRIKADEAEGKSPAGDSAKGEKTASNTSKGGFWSHLWPF